MRDSIMQPVTGLRDKDLAVCYTISCRNQDVHAKLLLITDLIGPDSFICVNNSTSTTSTTDVCSLINEKNL